MKQHGDKPKLFEYDETEDIIDIFIKREDQKSPYPFTNNDTWKKQEGEWYHQGLHLKDFIIRLNDFLKCNDVPYKIKKEGESIEIFTEEQWKEFIKELENVKYDEELAQFYLKRRNKYKISRKLKK